MLTSRERFRKALRNEETDRPPIDFGGCHDTTMTRGAYLKLKKYLGQPENGCDTAVFWEDTVFPDDDLLNAMHVDTRCVYLPTGQYNVTHGSDGSDEYTDEYGVFRRRPKGGHFYDIVKVPLTGELTLKDIEEYKWPEIDPVWFEQALKDAEQRAKYLYENTDYAIVGSCLIAPMTFTMLLRGFEDWSIDIMMNPEVIEALMDAFIEYNLKVTNPFYQAVGKYCDAVYCLGDDLATQNNLWLPADQYRKYIKPRHTRIINETKKYTNAKILFHSCGAVSELIPDLVESGIDALTPVQVNARGMESDKLKKEYGNIVSFWGGIDTQKVLPFGTTEDVRNEVFKRLDDFCSVGGGYVLNTVHNILPEVPPENVMAMIKAVDEWVDRRRG